MDSNSPSISSMQDTFARACTRPKGLTNAAARPSAHLTIGYLVYKSISITLTRAGVSH